MIAIVPKRDATFQKTLKRIPMALWIAVKNAGLYPPEHPGFVDSLKEFTDTLNAVLKQQREVTVGFLDGMIYLDGELAVEESLEHSDLIRLLDGIGVVSVVFVSGLEAKEITEFVTLLTRESKSPSQADLDQVLESRGVVHLRIASTSQMLFGGAGQENESLEKNLVALIGKTLQEWETVRPALGRTPKPSLRKLLNLLSTLITQTLRHREIVLAGSYCPSIGEGAQAHALRVMILAVQMAQLLELSHAKIYDLALTALFHDAEPTDGTPSTATRREWLSRLGSFREIPVTVLLALTELEHRTLLDSPKDHVFAKILQACDHFDQKAWASPTSKTQPPPHRVLRRMFALSGKTFDPLVLKLLVHTVGYYPVGSLLLLDNGEWGLVTGVTALHPGRPRVALLDPTSHQPKTIVALDETRPEKTGFARSVKRVLDARRLSTPVPALLELALSLV